MSHNIIKAKRYLVIEYEGQLAAAIAKNSDTTLEHEYHAALLFMIERLQNQITLIKKDLDCKY